MWTLSGEIQSARLLKKSVLLEDGRVLIIGGYDQSSDTVSNLTDLYNVASNTASPGPQMTHGRIYFSITKLKDGKIMVIGGRDQVMGSNLNSIEIFDPQTNSWSA